MVKKPKTRSRSTTARSPAGRGKTTRSIAREPFHVLAKPTGALCNLDCTYCYFLSKESLYEGAERAMGDDVLEAYIRQVVEAQPGHQTAIAWQGGEPTLLGLEFFERAMQLVERYRPPGMLIEHTMQTSGTLLDERWCAFFRERKVLVGLSLDGPRVMHDRYRVDKGGKPTLAANSGSSRSAAWSLRSS